MQEDFVKVTSATYKLLDVVPEQDPLKNKAKEKVLAVLENLTLIFENHGWLSLKNYWSEERQTCLKGVLEDILILEGYLEVIKNQGWINAMNFLILKKEYGDIRLKIAGITPEVKKITQISSKTPVSVV
ncbi:MAG TPA: hypothetical protein VN457_01205, partial [Chlamydiales bacterium]|nr:hypothetical protein [Chlamydiales bacterium]